MKDFFEESRNKAETMLEDLAYRLRKGGFRVDTTVREGDPAKIILDCEAEFAPDLLILGSHNRKGVQRLLNGSVSETVARHAHCSVEIVRAESEALPHSESRTPDSLHVS